MTARQQAARTEVSRSKSWRRASRRSSPTARCRCFAPSGFQRHAAGLHLLWAGARFIAGPDEVHPAHHRPWPSSRSARRAIAAPSGQGVVQRRGEAAGTGIGLAFLLAQAHAEARAARPHIRWVPGRRTQRAALRMGPAEMLFNSPPCRLQPLIFNGRQTDVSRRSESPHTGRCAEAHVEVACGRSRRSR